MNEFSDMPMIELGEYEHYKGNRYRVLGVGCHSEVREYYVVYQPITPNGNHPAFWLRPYDMFMETVTVNGKTVPRFKKLND